MNFNILVASFIFNFCSLFVGITKNSTLIIMKTSLFYFWKIWCGLGIAYDFIKFEAGFLTNEIFKYLPYEIGFASLWDF